MIFLIILVTILAILIVLFVSWFLITRANGNCPICAITKFVKPTKITMDINDTENYATTAKTPPMGWSSWNTFRQDIDEELIYDTAKAMASSGLKDAGYEYINLDDCWHSSVRDDLGRLQGDFVRFSSTIPNLIEKISELQLKTGLYSSNGTLTCEDLPASLGNETLDAKTLASWGCEFFKYDFCHHKIIHGDAPMIEAVDISKEGQSEVTTYTADDVTYTGRGKAINNKAVPTGKVMAFLGYGAGTASFDTSVLEGGEYIVTLRFNKVLCRHEQYLVIEVNNEEKYELFFPKTMGPSPTARKQVKIKLNEGTNKIKLYNPVVTNADSSYIQYKRMGKALKDATKEWAELTGKEEKPITFSICEWGFAAPYQWGAKAGNLWRTTPDIFAKWTSIKTIYDHTVKLYKYAAPGAWNDPDMLEVGNGKLTEDENKAHFSVWCMMASPLILGNDLRKFVDGNGDPVKENQTLKIVTNKNLIAIDQDPLGRPCKRIIKKVGYDVLARPLQNGDVAVCLFNKGTSKKAVSFSIDSLSDDEYLNFRKTPGNYEVHELWDDERFNDSIIKTTLKKHSVKVYRIHNV